MEFRQNLAEIKDEKREENATFFETPTKKSINELLFEMPMTTIADLEDLACAIFKTVADAWKDYANVEAVRVEIMGPK